MMFQRISSRNVGKLRTTETDLSLPYQNANNRLKARDFVPEPKFEIVLDLKRNKHPPCSLRQTVNSKVLQSMTQDTIVKTFRTSLG